MIYTSRYIKTESAIEDAIQTPDEVGVDLDQVEKDIAGDEGIEAHADEVEAAEEGTVGDPIEEAFNIMFESEYNFNSIMSAIGVAELREAAMGRELVMEAADVKGFFQKVKDMLAKMFASITKAVKTVLSKMDVQAKLDKKFVTKHEKEILKGAEGAWEAKGYVYGEDLKKFGHLQNSDALHSAKKYTDAVEKAIAAAAKGATLEEARADVLKVTGNGEDMRGHIIKTVAGVDAGSIEDMTTELVKKIRGEKVDLKGKVKASDVIDVLKNDRETATIRATYNEIKKSYKESLVTITKWEKEAADKSYAGVVTGVCVPGISAVKFEKNALHATYAVYMKMARAKRAQARALAHKFYSQAGKDDKAAKKAEKGAKNESATIFGGITIL